MIRTPRREALAAHLAAQGIDTVVHYPIPMHLQPAYREMGLGPGSIPGRRGGRAAGAFPAHFPGDFTRAAAAGGRGGAVFCGLTDEASE